MIKVITYGTYDLLHYGHINLLKRAKELGDYLIVGITTENFDRSRGKLLVQQSLNERIEALKATGLVDEIILEEYEGQKIDDIKKYNIDIFAIGSDWKGKFDYLSEYCKVVYLSRTEGVSSTKIRNKEHELRIGVVGFSPSLTKFIDESNFISGISVTDIYDSNPIPEKFIEPGIIRNHIKYEDLLSCVDAIYINTAPVHRYEYSKRALESRVHVLSETPVTLTGDETEHLYNIAKENNVIFCEALKTAYSLAFQRLSLLLHGGIIGEIKSLEATCTSLSKNHSPWLFNKNEGGGAINGWGSYVIFAALSLLGEKPKNIKFITSNNSKNLDIFTKIHILYNNSEATLKTGIGVKAEGDMIISGTKGYIYVPAPWWKMDYFEVRKEDIRENKKFFYQFEGEGIRYELAEFIKCIRYNTENHFLPKQISKKISSIINDYHIGNNTINI